MDKRKEVLLTGVKPTGVPHIGNYFGAIKPAIDMANSGEYDSNLFIADYHALTTVQDPKKLRQYNHEIASTWLAAGLDPEMTRLYRQSDVPETFELSTILHNVTPKGLMNRAHAYKAMAQANNENGQDTDAGVNMGLYNYPILMAADIMLMNANKVPVGQDQKQHIEIAQDIGKSFNSKFKKCLVIPQPLIGEEIGVIPGLDGRKMSKSYGNQIPLFGNEKELANLVKKIKTDSSLPHEPKPLDSSLFEMYKLFATPEQLAEMQYRFENGIGWGDVKKEVAATMNEYLGPMRERFDYLMANPGEVEEILQDGASRARVIASETVDRVREAVGVPARKLYQGGIEPKEDVREQ